jgi:hypothetical protein
MATKWNVKPGYAKSKADSYLKGGQSGASNPANTTASTASKASRVSSGIGAGLQTAGYIAEDVQEFNTIKDFDVEEALPQQNYNPYFQPPSYIQQDVPDEISKGTGGRAMMTDSLQYMGSGASLGMSVGGPIGAAIGAGVGLVGGLVSGGIKGAAAKKKRQDFEATQDRQYQEYLQANQRYYDVLGTQSRAQAQAQSIAKRGQNVTPYYDATIYGFV